MVMALSTGKQELKLVFSLPRWCFVLHPHLNSFVYLAPLFKSLSSKPHLKYAIGVCGGDGEGIASEFSVSFAATLS